MLGGIFTPLEFAALCNKKKKNNNKKAFVKKKTKTRKWRIQESGGNQMHLLEEL